MCSSDMRERLRAAALEAIGKLGGLSATAAIFDINPSAVSCWKDRGVPPHRVQVVAARAGMAPHQIRPDVFPAPVEAA
jgi:DNA-binding transcriptional regulator YdaS (Cro superfamily)